MEYKGFNIVTYHPGSNNERSIASKNGAPIHVSQSDYMKFNSMEKLKQKIDEQHPDQELPALSLAADGKTKIMKVKSAHLEALKSYFFLKPNEALTLVVNSLGYEIGVATENEQGYTGTRVIVDIQNYNDAHKIVDDLNAYFFPDRSARETAKIINSTMRVTSR